MTNPALERERDVAIRALREAALLCQAVRAQADPGTLSKRDKSPVTVADFGSQALVGRALEQAFPDDRLVAEEDAADLRAEGAEDVFTAVLRAIQALHPRADRDDVFAWIDRGGGQPGGRFWTLDPIDGTKGFLRAEQYAIALALIVDGSIELAALACPNLLVSTEGNPVKGALFTAVRGQGATCLALDGSGAERPIRVSSQVDFPEARFCESVESGHSDQGDSARLAADLGITQPPVRLDSQAKYAVVARGEAEIYLRLPTRADYQERIWDHAAGALVVTEAGGRVTDIQGKALDFSQGRTLAANRGVVASCGTLHDAVLRAIEQLA